ncbi:G5 domain-containing protein [Facklamia sp. P9177]|uniref:G5 domain-containing protein n=1 Tax=Facklamia sp. P9177 TaxID=3421945 RepID=UPI003D186B05
MTIKPVNFSLVPKNERYPSHIKSNVTDDFTIDTLYHGLFSEYELNITSDWYENVTKKLEDFNLIVNPKTKTTNTSYLASTKTTKAPLELGETYIVLVEGDFEGYNEIGVWLNEGTYKAVFLKNLGGSMWYGEFFIYTHWKIQKEKDIRIYNYPASVTPKKNNVTYFGLFKKNDLLEVELITRKGRLTIEVEETKPKNFVKNSHIPYNKEKMYGWQKYMEEKTIDEEGIIELGKGGTFTVSGYIDNTYQSNGQVSIMLMIVYDTEDFEYIQFKTSEGFSFGEKGIYKNTFTTSPIKNIKKAYMSMRHDSGEVTKISYPYADRIMFNKGEYIPYIPNKDDILVPNNGKSEIIVQQGYLDYNGRNLLINGRIEKTYETIGWQYYVNSIEISRHGLYLLNKGGNFRISGKIKNDFKSNVKVGLMFMVWYTDRTYEQSHNHDKNILPGEEGVFIHDFNFKPSKEVERYEIAIRNNGGSVSDISYSKVSKLKLEKVETFGQPYDYSMAPEEMMTNLDGEFQNNLITKEVKYHDVPYVFNVYKEYFHLSEYFRKIINNQTPNQKQKVILEYKPATWEEVKRVLSLPYSRTTVNDNNRRPSDSYLRSSGTNGSKEAIHYVEKIDGSITRGKTKTTEIITKQPVNEIYIQGTATVEWKREVYKTEPIPYSNINRNTNTMYIGETRISQSGITGVRSYYREVEYLNGSKTTNYRNIDTSGTITKSKRDQITLVGTKPREATITFNNKFIFKTKLYEWQGYSPITINVESDFLIGKDIISVRFDGKTYIPNNGKWIMHKEIYSIGGQELLVNYNSLSAARNDGLFNGVDSHFADIEVKYRI